MNEVGFGQLQFREKLGMRSLRGDLTKTQLLGRNGSRVCTNPSPFILHAEYAKRVISFPNWCACPSWKQRTILERHELAATTSQAKASLFSKHGQSQISFSVPRSHYHKLIPHRSIFLFCEIELKFCLHSSVTNDDQLLVRRDCYPWVRCRDCRGQQTPQGCQGARYQLLISLLV